ncbi:SH3 domain-containing C40 family peptidase [Helicobacter sp. WB40]|uniref:SH3 domain-containing C40 family peptidase n=1 Tax=Helicobacter sp. WB40 TaxID=3004130 RepID=UPI0022EBEF83|nr:SH3 domain-containing C40 family peptidase [Helicobacter sp. WB40]MDA3966617.1 SH3 domain-containing protein [Helicobacter sp. WB40]
MALKIILFSLAFLLFSACSTKDITLPPQDINLYTQESLLINTKNLKDSYLESFFAPFKIKENTKTKHIAWALDMAYSTQGYGENLLPLKKEEIQLLESEANYNNFPNSKLKYAIIAHSSNLRALPTNKPFFKNPNKAGEGFPFDYFQNSYIYANTPIIIKHYSQSKAWAFVESGFVSGWIESKNIAYLNKAQLEKYKNIKNFIIPKNDYIELKSNDRFLEYARVGMILPVYKNKILLFVRDENGNAKEKLIKINRDEFLNFPLNFSEHNYALIANSIVGEKYGWGGMFGNRDCSMFLRDTFSNFGIYLPRNSQAQIKADTQGSKYYPLDKLNPQEKLDFIKKNAIPFATLLGLKGHIMLYIGEHNGEMLVLHDVWGLKMIQKETNSTSKEMRHIIGKIAITQIDIGKNNSNIPQDSLFINRIYGMLNLFENGKIQEHE